MQGLAKSGNAALEAITFDVKACAVAVSEARIVPTTRSFGIPCQDRGGPESNPHGGNTPIMGCCRYLSGWIVGYTDEIHLAGLSPCRASDALVLITGICNGRVFSLRVADLNFRDV